MLNRIQCPLETKLGLSKMLNGQRIAQYISNKGLELYNLTNNYYLKITQVIKVNIEVVAFWPFHKYLETLSVYLCRGTVLGSRHSARRAISYGLSNVFIKWLIYPYLMSMKSAQLFLLYDDNSFVFNALSTLYYFLLLTPVFPIIFLYLFFKVICLFK